MHVDQLCKKNTLQRRQDLAHNLFAVCGLAHLRHLVDDPSTALTQASAFSERNIMLHKFRLQSSNCLRACLLGLLLALPALAQAVVVGSIAKIEGVARIVGADGERTARLNLDVEEGERVLTEANAELVIKMVDGAVLALRPNSQVLITTYRFTQNDKQAKEDSSVVQLVKGALRSVTGLIGKRNPAAVQVRTITATVGIRGTDFELVLVEEDTPDAKAGSYNKVFDGGTYIEASNGQRTNVAPGQAAFAPQDVLLIASQFGVLSRMPPIFRIGKFDDVLKIIQDEAMRRIENEIRKKLPIPGGFPGLGDLLRNR